MKLTIHPIGCYQMYDNVTWFTSVCVRLGPSWKKLGAAADWLRDNAEQCYRLYPYGAYFESREDAELFVLRFSS